MRIGALAWLAMEALALAGAGRAWAEGAIAAGSTGDVVRYGIAFGTAIDVSKDMAAQLAVERCRTFKARRAAERCKVVATFSGECFAIAYDPTPGTPGAGWGVGPDQLAANQKAVAMCEQAAGPARKGYCQVERFGCDTTGPKPAPKPDAKPDAPGTDAKSAPDAKETKDVKQTKDASEAAKEPKDAKATGNGNAPEVVHGATPAKNAKADAAPVAPQPPAARPAPGPKTVAGPAAAEGRNPGAALLPVLAMAGVGLAYAAGQHLRGRLKGGPAERQILTGAALAIAAAIAVKLTDMAGAGATVAAALAGLIALGAALLA
jgi:hypothetical protein